uniref:CBS domain-containing protein n=1 Tax=Kalanchoe fedtschenkoi TaxID=63787 RepID=A0A7N0V5P2_KALFE
MQGFLRAARSFRDTMKQATNLAETKNVLARLRCVTSSPVMHQKGLENTTVAEVLISKGDESPGSWLWCRSNDTVHDAVKQMAKHNVGSLVVLKPGEQNLIAGIVTERDYLNKIIANERPPKTTSVGEIMTDEKKLIMMSSDTNILQAMQLMTGERHFMKYKHNLSEAFRNSYFLLNAHVIIRNHSSYIDFYRESDTPCSSHRWKDGGHGFN